MPTPANLDQACKLLVRIKAQIDAGTFCFADTFPKFRGLKKLPRGVAARFQLRALRALARPKPTRRSLIKCAPNRLGRIF